MKGWFARVLNRTATAAALLFAGDQSRARDLIGERQRQRSFGSHEPEPMPLENRNTGIGTVRGTAYRLRWAGGRRMEVFNGVDLQVLNAYNERGASAYLTSAKAGQPTINGSGDEILIRASDGTVTAFRLLPTPRRRRRR